MTADEPEKKAFDDGQRVPVTEQVLMKNERGVSRKVAAQLVGFMGARGWQVVEPESGTESASTSNTCSNTEEPAGNAKRDTWAAHAVESGAVTTEQAEGMTRAELIAACH